MTVAAARADNSGAMAAAASPSEACRRVRFVGISCFMRRSYALRVSCHSVGERLSAPRIDDAKVLRRVVDHALGTPASVTPGEPSGRQAGEGTARPVVVDEHPESARSAARLELKAQAILPDDEQPRVHGFPRFAQGRIPFRDDLLERQRNAHDFAGHAYT